MDLKSVPRRVGDHPFLASRPVVKQFVKFALVGAMNTLIDFIIFTSLLTFGHLHYLLANVIALVGGGTNSYFFNRRWTFRSNDPRWHQQVGKFLVVLIVGFALNEWLLYLFVAHGNLHPVPAKAIAIVIVLFFNFGANRLWTFRSSASVT